MKTQKFHGLPTVFAIPTGPSAALTERQPRMETKKTMTHRLLTMAAMIFLGFQVCFDAEAAQKQVATPTLHPASGTTFETSLKVTASTSNTGATIRYTTDGKEPKSNSPVFSSGGLNLTATTTVKVKAFKSGMKDSGVASSTYTKKVPPVATPKLTPASGTTFETKLLVQANTATTGATIRYTTDGGVPNNNSPRFPSGGLNLTVTTTVKVKAFKTGMTASATASGTYTKKFPQVATPKLTSASGTTFETKLLVQATTATSGATIRYTTSGSVPNNNSPVFPSGGLNLTVTTTVKVKAFKSGMKDSDVATSTYTKKELQVAIPVIRPDSGTYDLPLSVTITCTTSEAAIRYTLDGNDPKETSPIWPGPARVGSAAQAEVTLKARAFKMGMKASNVASAQYKQAPRVVLWLHGMNSDETTWNDVIRDSAYWGTRNGLRAAPSVPTIYAGSVLGDPQLSTPDKSGAYYYRVRFGSKDRSSGRKGVEGIEAPSSNTSGDFTDFNGLGQEVRDAVAFILDSRRHPGARIVLVGHSRGGLAARAFLQQAGSSPEKESIVALVTTGTPHAGSPLGRLYDYLDKNPRKNATGGLKSDWDLVDRLLSAIDVRRPVIGDLAPGSAEINTLAQRGGNLPASIKYGTQCYDNMVLGKLRHFPNYNVFKGLTFPYLPALSINASNSICAKLDAGIYKGDGIVPISSQTFTASHINVKLKTNTSGAILHGDEAKQMSDLRALLETLVTWWQ